MKVCYKAPGSCGEFIQGYIGGNERLISMPIDIYSTVSIETGKGNYLDFNGTKTLKALKSFMNVKGISENLLEEVVITIDSDLPIAKGMASSTADMLGILHCAKDYFDESLSYEEIAKICCDIEPTDSTIFENITLFDHINGVGYKSYNKDINLKVFILEMDELVDTISFRSMDCDNKRRNNQSVLEKALSKFEAGFDICDYNLIGEACNLSAIANQSILYKPYLREIINAVIDCGGYGVNVAHSGTVIGILFNDGILDFDRLKKSLDDIGVSDIYSKNYIAKVINHGIIKIK